MSAICFVFGLKVSFGNSRSNSNIKTRRKFSPNITIKSFHSDILNQDFSLKISAKGIRTIYKHGSLDNYLLTTRMLSLTDTALVLKRKIKKASKKLELQTAKN
jgi:large subunit ribosomal protein L28